jgi:hypothetical protein
VPCVTFTRNVHVDDDPIVRHECRRVCEPSCGAVERAAEPGRLQLISSDEVAESVMRASGDRDAVFEALRKTSCYDSCGAVAGHVDAGSIMK